MNKKIIIIFIGAGFLLAAFLSSYRSRSDHYPVIYFSAVDSLNIALNTLYNVAATADLDKKETLVTAINQCRNKLKACDFWLRYTEPNAYKKLNGPLPVEWETEVFEKYEPPYKREGAGLSLAYIYLQTGNVQKDSLLRLIGASREALKIYLTDSVTAPLHQYHQFFLCNRLFLLNLATIYTTGFECPDKNQIIPELQNMLQAVSNIYNTYNLDFPGYSLKDDYLTLYKKTISFVQDQPKDFSQFDHFSFTRDFVNPLYSLNQQYMLQYNVSSTSWMDYTLNDKTGSIFDKSLFWAQNNKGIYSKITDSNILAEIDSIGKLLFYDPILSGNNQRSCASCHKPDNYFTDTVLSSPFQFDHTGSLTRNAPSLVNVVYNHLIHLDGKFLTLQDQAKGVMTNDLEMGGKEELILQNVLSCGDYKKYLGKFAAYTNEKDKVSLKHIISALTLYYGKFSNYHSPFDDAMNNKRTLTQNETAGFNLFMSKAQCATCHFAPIFNGIKPPYINNEFEVIGVPQDTLFKTIGIDSGRYGIYAATETRNAFRTPTMRNVAFTKPYMHNAVFKTLDEVIDFYDTGGGAGKGIRVENQTLSSDSLRLTKEEKKQLIAFINSLNEEVKFELPPQKLPASKNKILNRRKIGGEY